MSRKVVESIISLLNQHKIGFQIFEHEPVRTSEEAAFMRAQRSGLTPEEHLKRGAKAMVLRSEGKFLQVVISASKKVDLSKVKKILNTDSLSLASPEEVERVIDCVPGAVPPFGSLFNIPVYVDKSLLLNEFMDFNAGEKTISMEMKVKDWQSVVNPIVCDVAQ